MDFVLRCHAWREGRRWHAICTDLDIAADGASFEDAKASLSACIDLYLEAVAESPPEERHRLLHRRAPWHVRAKLAMWTALHGLLGGNDRSQGFVLQSHAPVNA